MISQGVKIGGGVVDKYRPYKGYKLCYGEIGWSTFLQKNSSIGCIPLSLYCESLDWDFSSSNGGSGYISVTSSTGGTKELFYGRIIGYNGPQVWPKSRNIFDIDLVRLFDFNLDDVKNIVEIKFYYAKTMKVSQWLEPISSGGI